MAKDSKIKSKIYHKDRSNVLRKPSNHSNHKKQILCNKKSNSNSDNISAKGEFAQKFQTSMVSSAPMQGTKNLSSLQLKFAKKLQGSRFRMINESLYTKTGKDSLLEFQNNPALFEQYHEGLNSSIC